MQNRCISIKSFGTLARTSYIWGLLAILGALFLFLVGCGLPEYTSLEKPIKMDYVDFVDDPAEPELPSTVIAFRTPLDDTNILGYVIYYKVYYSNTDDPDFIATGEEMDDEDYFDEYTYINNNEEMQPGSVIPDQRGFLLVGEVGKNTFGEFFIEHPGPDEAIYIDFDPIESGSSFSDLRYQPLVGFDFDDNAIPPVTRVNPIKILARGFIDPTDISAYTNDGIGPSDINPGNTFRLFVADWEFDLSSPGPYDDDFHDGDLRREYYVLQYQPGTEISDIESCGTPHFDGETLPSGDMAIGFVVYSFGRDISGGSFQTLASQPVYFGDIIYSPLNDVNRQDVEGR